MRDCVVYDCVCGGCVYVCVANDYTFVCITVLFMNACLWVCMCACVCTVCIHELSEEYKMISDFDHYQCVCGT